MSNPEQTNGEKEIFEAALDRAPGEERRRYLEGACGDDTVLLARIQALLHADEAGEDFLSEQPKETKPIITEKPGDQIGPYRLLQQIGEGGCGVVYMAEQEAPVRRRVALKIIKAGMDTKSVIARFEAERQALALMDHLNIAKVLEAGATAAGRPYFVMELVGGSKITDYCEENHLTTRQRLDLFIQVCRAIQHAHQKGVIHRDIKPSNVLVATQDGVAVPKVIDFGIAKATQGRLTNDTVFTAFEQFLGTPAYMSPEQAQLGHLDVDTRSDIYCLGVLLYELLSGKTPFDAKELLAAGLEAMRRTIQEKEPPTPSTRLKQDTAVRAATSDNSDLRPPTSALDKDLDWIVMKCLEKDRARRYDTAIGLAMDIERHLKHEPVVAGPPSKIYLLHKFIRRNRAVTAIGAVLLLGIVLLSWETARALRAEREQARLLKEAQAAKKDATENLWSSYLAEARALRMSGQQGRRFESLATLRKAAAIRPSLALTDEAIASMILPDIKWVWGKDRRKIEQTIKGDPSFERYAVCEQTGEVSVRRVADDAELARLPGGPTGAKAVSHFSPDGKFLVVSCADGLWRVWDWAKPLVAAEGELGPGFPFATNSRIFAVSDSTNITLRDLISGKRLNAISLNGLASKQAPGRFAFDPTGQRLALFWTEADTNVLILEAKTGRIVKTLQHPSHVWNLAWHPDGKHLVSGSEKTIHVWDTISGELVRQWSVESCISLCFNHQGTLLASSGWDGYTRLWDFATGREQISILMSGHLAFSSDDKRLSADGWDGQQLHFFDVAEGNELRTIYEAPVKGWNAPDRPILDISGRFFAFRTQMGLALWDMQTLRQLCVLELPLKQTLVGFDAEGRNLILTGPEGLFRCPITETAGLCALGRPVLMSTECADSVWGRVGMLSANGKACAIVSSNRCQIFQADTFKKQAETGILSGMRFSDISPDGSLFASGIWQRPGVKVWDAHTGALIKELPTELVNYSASVVFSPDGRHLVTATAKEYCFWEVSSWSLVRRIPEVSDGFMSKMAFTRDGRIFAGSHSRNKIRLYDFATGQVLADLEAPKSGMITGLAFNPDATQLLVCESADAVRLWDLKLIRKQLVEMGLDYRVRSHGK